MPEQPFNKTTNTGLLHLLNAMRFSYRGLKRAYQEEAAFRQELLLIALLLPSGAWFADTQGEWVLLCGACFLVLGMELMNSAIEAVVDRIGVEQHPMSGKAKDYGSAAVFMTLLILGMVWGYLLLGWVNNTFYV